MISSVHIANIEDERRRQDRIWGGPVHDDRHSTSDWALFINERTQKIVNGEKSLTTDEMYKLFTHIAALALAAMESIDRTSD
jgi:hypothetical protein